MKNTLETRLGIFFALALIVAALLLELVGAFDPWKPSYPITASFANAQELKKGDQVKMAGVQIGRVEEIGLEAGRARVLLKIQKKYEKAIKTDSKAVIRFTGLMGQNFIAVEGGTADAPIVQSGGSLETAEQPNLGTLMAKLEGVATGVEGLTKSFSTDNISTLVGPLTDFFKQNAPVLTAMLGNLRVVSDKIASGEGTVGRLVKDDTFYTAAFGAITNLQSASADLKGLMTQTEGLVTDARTVIARFNSGEGTLGKLAKDDALYREFTDATVSLKEILQKMNRGQGTVGKLINDDMLYRNAKLSLQKLEKATEGLEDQGPLSVLGIAVNSLF